MQASPGGNLVERLEARTFLSAGDVVGTFGHRGILVDQRFGAPVALAATRLGPTKPRLLVADASGVERFYVNGSLDTAFARGGRFGLGKRSAPWLVGGMAVQPDGKILLCGHVPSSGTVF